MNYKFVMRWKNQIRIEPAPVCLTSGAHWAGTLDVVAMIKMETRTPEHCHVTSTGLPIVMF